MRRKWEWIVAACFIILYLAAWHLLLSSIPVTWLKKLAFFWIVSFFVTIPLATLKKQNVLLSLVFVAILGPLALLLILFAYPELKYFSDKEKNEGFYQKLIQQIDLQFDRAVCQKHNIFYSGSASAKFMHIAGYFRVVFPKDSNYIPKREYLKMFKRVYEEFAKEYSAKFFRKFPGIEERLFSIERKEEESRLENEKIYQEMAAQYGKNKFAGVVLLLLQFLGAIVTLSIGVCALVALYYLFFSKAKPPDILLFPIVWVLNLCPPEHACPPFMTWEAAQGVRLESAFRLIIAAALGFFISICLTSAMLFTLPELTGRRFKKLEDLSLKLFFRSRNKGRLLP